jgi:small subunit ribosomal protein S4
MPIYRGPRFRIIRRLGQLPSLSKRVPKRSTRPGQHGATRIKLTPFAYRLIEKQKLRFYYGISEKQLVRYTKEARRSKDSRDQVIIEKLEIRLDVILYRAGWSTTLPAARQLVNHRQILVDQKLVTLAMFSCRAYQVIEPRKTSKCRKLIRKAWKNRTQDPPSHLSTNIQSLIIVVNRRAHYHEIPFDLSCLLVIEYYSNRILFCIIFTYFLIHLEIFFVLVCLDIFFLLFLGLW